jgi:hypothetical protein
MSMYPQTPKAPKITTKKKKIIKIIKIYIYILINYYSYKLLLQLLVPTSPTLWDTDFFYFVRRARLVPSNKQGIERTSTKAVRKKEIVLKKLTKNTLGFRYSVFFFFFFFKKNYFFHFFSLYIYI